MTSWDSRLKLYKENPNTLFLENIKDFGNFLNIPDGHKLLNKYLILANEIPGYSSITKDSNLNNIKVEKALYSTLFEYNKQNIELFTLGRYFGSKLNYYVEKNTPRKYVQDLILENKKRRGFEEFTNWSDHLQVNLEDLIHFVMKNSNKKSFLISSIPNSNGRNRFESFLQKICGNNRFKSFEIQIATNLIDTKGHENTMYSSEDKKIQILRNAYSVNKEYLHILKNKDCHLIIIDDVFTTGAHLKVAIEKISEIINLNTDKEYELLQAIAKAGTDYVIDAVITNRIRKGVNVNEILAKNNIQNLYDKAYIKQIINNKVLSFSGLFLATTQSNPEYNLDSGEFHALAYK
tara:strand:- start:121 stop:1167 length:1047 start_codon:yes stop_codon:yes gene_type:complete